MMSYADLYLTSSPKIISPSDDSEPVAKLFGIPFDSTHSYKPGCRFGPDAIRDAFNNIEIFQPEFGVDLELANIEDLGNLKHTVVATEMLEMVEKTTSELQKNNNQLIIPTSCSVNDISMTSGFEREKSISIFSIRTNWARNSYRIVTNLNYIRITS